MEKTLREVLEEVAQKEPSAMVVLSHRETGKKTFNKTEGSLVDNKILRWMDCLVLAYRMDCRQNILQVAVEGEPHEWK
jgi:hypothetical protein